MKTRPANARLITNAHKSRSIPPNSSWPSSAKPALYHPAAASAKLHPAARTFRLAILVNRELVNLDRLPRLPDVHFLPAASWRLISFHSARRRKQAFETACGRNLRRVSDEPIIVMAEPAQPALAISEVSAGRRPGYKPLHETPSRRSSASHSCRQLFVQPHPSGDRLITGKSISPSTVVPGTSAACP